MTEDGTDAAGDDRVEAEPLLGSEPSASTRYEFDPADSVSVASVLDGVFMNHLLCGWEGWTATEEVLGSQRVEISETLKCVILSITCRPIELNMDTASAELVHKGFSLPSLAEASEDEKRLWRETAALVTVPAARARIGEILIAVDPTTIGAQLPIIVDGYLSAIIGREEMAATTYLLRCHTLCRKMNSTALKANVVAEIEARVEKASVNEMLTSPGMYFLMLHILVEELSCKSPRADFRIDLATVLERLAESVVIDYLASRIAAMRRKIVGRGTPDVMSLISKQEVEGYLRNAESASEPAVKIAHLESAARIADKRGLSMMSREISAQMQEAARGDLGFQVIRTAGELPAHVPERYLRGFTQSLTWRGGLHRFMLQSDAPSGPVESHKEFARSQRGSLSRLIPPKIYGRDNLPRVTLSTEEDLDRQDMATSSRLFAETYGRWGACALVRIRDMYGIPELDEITAMICEIGARDIDLARSLARGFIHFWNGDIESCIAVVIPRIEAAARGLLRELDEGIYRVEKEKSQGGYIMLHSLLTRLDELALDPDWAWFLRWLLLGDVGINLRNDQAHGFISGVPVEYAALVLQAASVMITASPRITDDIKHVELAAVSTNPVRPRLQSIDWVLHRAEDIAVRVHISLANVRNSLR